MQDDEVRTSTVPATVYRIAHDDTILHRLDVPGGAIELSGPELVWTDYTREKGGAYEVEVRLVAEGQGGGFSAHIPQLPGVVSQGETEEEALENIKEALLGALRCYQDAGNEIPWVEAAAPKEPEELQRWVVVHA
jgi:predicted RNase H-like HicB family nuclease